MIYGGLSHRFHIPESLYYLVHISDGLSLYGQATGQNLFAGMGQLAAELKEVFSSWQ
jgi:hypothetical protein